MYSDHSAVYMALQVNSIKINLTHKDNCFVDWKLIQIITISNNIFIGNLFQALKNDLE